MRWFRNVDDFGVKYEKNGAKSEKGSTFGYGYDGHNMMDGPIIRVIL